MNSYYTICSLFKGLISKSIALGATPIILDFKRGKPLECVALQVIGNDVEATLLKKKARFSKDLLTEECWNRISGITQPEGAEPQNPTARAILNSSQPVETPVVLPTTELKRSTPTSAEEVLASALERAGDNRAELEKALSASNAPEIKLLISRARQYDLANLTSDLLLNTVEFTAQARKACAWASGIPAPIWEEFVLPYRLADEELDDWRGEFFKLLSPVVKDSTDSKTAALKVHQWFHTSGANKKKRVSFKVDADEDRDMSPRMAMKLGEAKCFDMNLCLAALLRSVGIPARVAGVPYWTGKMDLYHYWVEYWDTKTGQWAYVEGGNSNPDFFMARNTTLNQGMNLPFSCVYALPGFALDTDPFGKEEWSSLIATTPSYQKCGILRVTCPPTKGGGDISFAVYTFNYSTWRQNAAVTADSQGQAIFELASNEDASPYLVTAARDGQVVWDTTVVKRGGETTLRLDPLFARNEVTAPFPQVKKKEPSKKKKEKS